MSPARAKLPACVVTAPLDGRRASPHSCRLPFARLRAGVGAALLFTLASCHAAELPPPAPWSPTTATSWSVPRMEAIAGIRINAIRSPRPGAPQVLILAPWPLTLESLRDAWPTLTASLDVTAIDPPGFGLSESLPGPPSPSATARFLGQVIDHFGLRHVHLVGTDVGVPVALLFAADNGARVASLVLSDGPGTATPVFSTDLQRMEGSGFFRWFFALSPSTFVHTAVKNGYRLRHPPDTQVAAFVAAYSAPGRLAESMEFLATYPNELPVVERGLSRITSPALLLWGGDDVYVPPENTRRIHAKLAASEVTLLKDTGHFSMDDNPEGWADAVVQWCLRWEKAPPAASPQPG